jgi:hypothetical protein
VIEVYNLVQKLQARRETVVTRLSVINNMAAVRNFEEYPTYLKHPWSTLKFQYIYKGKIKYANTTVIQWDFMALCSTRLILWISDYSASGVSL